MFRLSFLIVFLLSGCYAGQSLRQSYSVNPNLNLEIVAKELTSNGYKSCNDGDYCFIGNFIVHFNLEKNVQGLAINFPAFHISRRNDVGKELKKIESILSSDIILKKLCRVTETTWIFINVGKECTAI